MVRSILFSRYNSFSLPFWYIVFPSLFVFVCLGCSSQKSIEKVRLQAEKTLLSFQDELESSNIEVAKSLLKNRDDDVIYFIFHKGIPIYWSHNSVSLNGLTIENFNQWYTAVLGKTKCLCRWTSIDSYTVLSIIPIQWMINKDGIFDKTFSYRSLGVANGRSTVAMVDGIRLIFFIILCLIVFVIIIFLFLIKIKRGFWNLSVSLSSLFVTIIFTMLSFFILVSHVYYFYLPKITERFKENLKTQTRYIQYSLQNLYPWVTDFSTSDTYGLNIDLRDIAYIYNTDIHVYDRRGVLVGSSSYQLFDEGLLSSFIHPDALKLNNLPMSHTEKIMGQLVYVSYAEFFNSNFDIIGYIAVASIMSDYMWLSVLFRYIQDSFVPFIGLLFITFLYLCFVYWNFSHRLRLIVKAMSHFQTDNNIIKYEAHDDFNKLVTYYNDKVRLVDIANTKQLQLEREAAWRTMARQIAHEINNPLTPMKLSIQQLQRLKTQGTETFNDYFDRVTHSLIGQIDSLSHIASSFSDFAKVPSLHINNVDIAQKLVSSISLFTNNEMNIPIRYLGPDKGIVGIADEEQICQVFNNIIRNAIQAVSDKRDGDIIISLKSTAETPYPKEIVDLNQYIEITISDNGCGIENDNLDKIFLPNFTTKNTGMGLGLAISKNILIGCGGKITFTTSNKGTTFFLYFRKV